MENSENSVRDTIIAALEAEKQVHEAQLNYENKLQAIIAQNGGATFEHESRWFQIRTRDDGERRVSYLCALKDNPKNYLRGRPKGSVNKKKPTSLTDVPTSVTEQLTALDAALEAEQAVVTPEGTTTVID